ncbi:glycosyltransferase family 4 protein [Thiohalocapsa marina]|uniref:glycosyltransferase family 4 protein n=1 Tax=Thiohalocapsa marina TaxID=424902 RepID=UPI001FE73778|nr:glycosyltransferase family 4 protein [Thiohalocapsa marina]
MTSNFPRWSGDSTTPFVLHLAQDLQAFGWQVDVLAPHASGAKRSEVIDGVRIDRFRYLWPEHQQTVCYQGGALVQLRNNPLNKLKLPALIAAEMLATVRRLRLGHYDLMHSHWILPQGFTGMVARRAHSLPHVVTVHGGDIFGLKGRFMEWFKRAPLHDADAVTVNSSVTEQAVNRVAPGVRLLERIPMGVSISPLDERQIALAAQLRERYRSSTGPLLLFTGRIVGEKGVEDLLLATNLLRRSLPNVRTLIVGDGPDRPALEQLAQSLGDADIINFSGWVAPHDIPAYLRAADIFIGPSRTAADGWIEAQGLAILEAMAARTPVIASRSGGIIDTVQHEETGILVDERAPEQIAAAIERIVHNGNLRRKITENAARCAQSRFSRDSSAKAFSALFAQLVPHCKSGSPEPTHRRLK